MDDGFDLFLTIVLYPNFGWDEPGYHLEGDPEGRSFAEILVDVVATCRPFMTRSPAPR